MSLPQIFSQTWDVEEYTQNRYYSSVVSFRRVVSRRISAFIIDKMAKGAIHLYWACMAYSANLPLKHQISNAC